MNSPSTHISLDQLADLIQDHLAIEERAPVLAHVSACDQCAEGMRWLSHVLSLTRSDANEDAPPHVLMRAMRLLRKPTAPQPLGPLRRVLATLRFDSAQMPAAFGVRAERRHGRHMLFNADGHDLDIHITNLGADWLVFGQVFGSSGNGRVELWGSTNLAEAALNDMSTFALPPVPAGSYALRLHLSNVEIEIAGLELGM